VPGLRVGSPSHLANTWRRDITDGWGEGMTEEELAMYALVLKECERIRACEDSTARKNMPHRAGRPYARGLLDTAHDAALARSQHHKSANE